MKLQLIIFCLFTFSLLTVQAQDTAYTTTMQGIIAGLDDQLDEATLEEKLRQMERVAAVEQKAWLPAYYVAYFNIRLARQALTQKESAKMLARLGVAQKVITQAKALAAAPNDELQVLQAQLYLAQLWENPMGNGAIYTPLIHNELGQAIALNPRNPRAYLIRSQLLLFTPSFYGGGPAAAQPDLEKAQTLYEDAPATAIAPDWGRPTLSWMWEQLEKMKTAN